MRMFFAAAHKSACGTSRQFVATHQFGRYRRYSGHIESGFRGCMANPLVTSNHEVRRHFTHLPPCGSFPPPKRIAGATGIIFK